MIHRRKLLAGLGASIIVPKAAQARTLLNPFWTSAPVVPLTLEEMIDSAGLNSNLVLCLDAAHDNSYDGTGQVFQDLSGNSNNFFLGSSGATQATDPTFNGTPNGKSSSEFFSFDGADFFQETANHGFEHTWHQNNAVFTIVAAVFPQAGPIPIFFNNDGGSFDKGIWFYRGSDLKLKLEVDDGSAFDLELASTATAANGAWAFCAVALNEATGANGATLQVNGTQESFTSTYVTPASTNPGAALKVAHLSDTSRFGCIAAWSTRLTDGDLSALYAALAIRYGF